VINEKGIDPICLKLFGNETIFALIRGKGRKERIVLACRGTPVMNSVEELTEKYFVWKIDIFQ
jgi:T-complex protein 1 subunit zeta